VRVFFNRCGHLTESLRVRKPPGSIGLRRPGGDTTPLQRTQAPKQAAQPNDESEGVPEGTSHQRRFSRSSCSPQTAHCP